MNKKGTPLYSREDIREQYCINDKELQVLDRSQRKSLLGCFSNQGQVSRTRQNLRGGLLPLPLPGSFRIVHLWIPKILGLKESDG